jgi:hypothetical protein
MDDRALAIRKELGIEQLGEIIWRSGFFADTRSQAQAVVKILAGGEMGFGPIASMNGVYIVNGKTAPVAGLIAAAIQRSRRYRYRVTEHTDTQCSIDFFELGEGAQVRREKLGTSTFSMADAAQAGLATTAMYRKFPKNMLFNRALTNGARWFCPEVFGGPVYTPDELGLEVNAEGAPLEVIEVPQGPPSVPLRERDVEDAAIIRSADDSIWQRWLQVLAEAQGLGIQTPRVRLPIAQQTLIEHGLDLANQITVREQQLADQDAAVAAGRVQPDDSPGPSTRTARPAESVTASADEAGADASPADSAWGRNRALQAEAYAAGLRLPELGVHSTDDEIAQQNAYIEAWLRAPSAERGRRRG